jgi:Leucine-rich repeat (LRR) protein
LVPVDNSFHTLPESFGELPALKNLIITDSCLKFIPPSISKLENLEKCSIRGPDLTLSEESMNGFPRLKELEIWGGSEIVLPSNIEKLTTLKKLNLAANVSRKSGRIVLPESFGNLHGLEELTLSCDRLEETAGCIGRLSLKTLELQCDLLPESIVNIKFLQKLLIAANIEEIPPFIGKMRNLKGLSLDTPRITSIPDSIGNLDKLVFLHMCCENMGDIPSCINRLVSLEYLELWGMNIDKLPESLADLPNLKDIDYSGSVIKEIPGGLEQFIHPWDW